MEHDEMTRNEIIKSSDKFSSPLRAVIVAIQLPTDHTGDLDMALLVNKFPSLIFKAEI